MAGLPDVELRRVTMSIVRVVSEGLAHFSYFIENEGIASVIDPRRDCDVYLDLARKAGVRITRIFETHRNEDYVVGSLELFERTGAEIVYRVRAGDDPWILLHALACDPSMWDGVAARLAAAGHAAFTVDLRGEANLYGAFDLILKVLEAADVEQ